MQTVPGRDERLAPFGGHGGQTQGLRRYFRSESGAAEAGTGVQKGADGVGPAAWKRSHSLSGTTELS